MKRWLVIFGLVCGLSGLAAPAQAGPLGDITTADAIAIHDVVQAQLEAFAKDDAVAAFELATLEKRVLIGSPDNFMRLIRELYEPIYRHKMLIYSRPEVVHGNAVQLVRVTDRQSKVWVAIFWMQQDDNLQWKIDGCHLLETATVSI